MRSHNRNRRRLAIAGARVSSYSRERKSKGHDCAAWPWGATRCSRHRDLTHPGMAKRVFVAFLAICVRPAHAESGAFNQEALPSLEQAILNEAAEAWDVVNALSAAIETGAAVVNGANGSNPDYTQIARNMNSVIHASRMVKNTLWLHYYSTTRSESFGFMMEGLSGVEGEYTFYHSLDDFTCAQYDKPTGCSVEVCQYVPQPRARPLSVVASAMPRRRAATAPRCRRADTSPRRAYLKACRIALTVGVCRPDHRRDC